MRLYDSDKIIDGYGIFGCKYGWNILNEIIYDEAIVLPIASDGKVFTENNKNDFNISIRQNGTLTCNNAFVKQDQLNEILSQAKTKSKSALRVFLWIDKKCPGKYIKPVTHMIYNTDI